MLWVPNHLKQAITIKNKPTHCSSAREPGSHSGPGILQLLHLILRQLGRRPQDDRSSQLWQSLKFKLQQHLRQRTEVPG